MTAQSKGFGTYEEALDEAVRLLQARFDEVDQQAAVGLADALYTLQDRDRFLQRDKQGEIPYRA